jgi:hypothetical protein
MRARRPGVSDGSLPSSSTTTGGGVRVVTVGGGCVFSTPASCFKSAHKSRDSGAALTSKLATNASTSLRRGA